MDIPKFLAYWEGVGQIEEAIQPKFELRSWDDLDVASKKIIFQEFKNLGYFEISTEIFRCVFHLNKVFLWVCPWKSLHAIVPDNSQYWNNSYKREMAAFEDFERIFFYEGDALVMRMLSELAYQYIDHSRYAEAEKESDPENRKNLVDSAFKAFDRFAISLNRVFDHFCINKFISRNWLIDKQDKIFEDIVYEPVLSVLSDPKWKSVSDDLSEMFDDYSQCRYEETIAKAHRTVQRFLQILLWEEEGKNGKWELSSLFAKARTANHLSDSPLMASIHSGMQWFLSNTRSKMSTAKPSTVAVTQNDALLVMNVTLVLIQHFLR